MPSRKDKTLYQSRHILHKQGRYFIVHLKNYLKLDGKPTNFSENDQKKYCKPFGRMGSDKVVRPQCDRGINCSSQSVEDPIFQGERRMELNENIILERSEDGEG